MVPGTAIGRDHAGEQEVKKLKTRGGIKGITRNDNSRMRHFLVAPILSEISKEMEVMGNGIEVERNKLHHQRRKTHTANQNKRISSLLDVFKNNNFELFPLENVLKDLVTGQVYPDDVCYDILSAEKIGEQLYDNFIIESENSENSMLKTFKICNRNENHEVEGKNRGLAGELQLVRTMCNFITK